MVLTPCLLGLLSENQVVFEQSNVTNIMKNKSRKTGYARTKFKSPYFRISLIFIFLSFSINFNIFPVVSIIAGAWWRSPKIAKDCQRSAKIPKDRQRSPWITEHHQRKIAKQRWRSPKIAKDHRSFAKDPQRSPKIVKDPQRSPKIIKDHRR